GLFVAVPNRVQLLGVTQQLVGLTELAAPPFAWCGTIAPISLPEDCAATVRRIGEVVATACGLRGLFGCDFVLADGMPWLTEINPRYTAAAEIIEHLLRVPLLDLHRQACDGAMPA